MSGEDALGDMQRMVRDARQAFLEEVATVLRDGEHLAGSFALAIGEISAEIALEAWKREMTTRIEGLGRAVPIYREGGDA